MEVIIRPTQLSDAQALCDIYSQPLAQRETLQLPNSSPQYWEQRLSHLSHPLRAFTHLSQK